MNAGEEFDDPYARAEEAKEVPLLELHSFQKLTQFGNRSKALCPLHKEKTPSFTVYHNNNSFYCYGCGKGGDVITFIQELNECSFKQALNIILK